MSFPDPDPKRKGNVILRSDSDEESKQLRFFAPEFTLSEANVGLQNDEMVGLI